MFFVARKFIEGIHVIHTFPYHPLHSCHESWLSSTLDRKYAIVVNILDPVFAPPTVPLNSQE